MTYVITTLVRRYLPGENMAEIDFDTYAQPLELATLDEVRQYVDRFFAFPAYGRGLTTEGYLLLKRAESDLDAMGESGGTVGPLPDGTIIEVRPINAEQLESQES